MLEARADKPIYKLATTITNQEGVIVLDGTALVWQEPLGSISGGSLEGRLFSLLVPQCLSRLEAARSPEREVQHQEGGDDRHHERDAERPEREPEREARVERVSHEVKDDTTEMSPTPIPAIHSEQRQHEPFGAVDAADLPGSGPQATEDTDLPLPLEHVGRERADQADHPDGDERQPQGHDHGDDRSSLRASASRWTWRSTLPAPYPAAESACRRRPFSCSMPASSSEAPVTQ